MEQIELLWATDESFRSTLEVFHSHLDGVVYVTICLFALAIMIHIVELITHEIQYASNDLLVALALLVMVNLQFLPIHVHIIDLYLWLH